MKKHLLILALLVLAGCAKEESPIVGTWALTDYTWRDAQSGKGREGVKTSLKTWTFTEGGSAYIDGSTPCTYSIRDRELVMRNVNTGESSRYDIQMLTSAMLKVHWFTPQSQMYLEGRDHYYTFRRMAE